MAIKVLDQVSNLILEADNLVLTTSPESSVEDVTAVIFSALAFQALGLPVKIYLPHWPLAYPLPFESWLAEQIPAYLTLNELPTDESLFLLFNILDQNKLAALNPIEQYWADRALIAISTNPEQEMLSPIRYVDITAPGLNTLMFKLIKNLSRDIIEVFDPVTASIAYAGLLIETEHWSRHRLSSQSLAAGGELLRLGAKHVDMETLLRASAEPQTLKYWGQILNQLKTLSSNLDSRVAYALIPGPGPVRQAGKIQSLEKHRLHRMATEFFLPLEIQGQSLRGAILVWPEDQGLCCVWCRDPLRAQDLADELGVQAHQGLIFFQSPSLKNLTSVPEIPAMLKYLASLIEA